MCSVTTYKKAPKQLKTAIKEVKGERDEVEG